MSRIKGFMFVTVLLLILFSFACSNAGPGTSTVVAPVVGTDIPTTIPENTPIPVLTETKPVPTPLPPIKTQCVNNPRETQKLDLRGVVALEKAAKQDDFEFGLFLLNLRNGNTIRDVEEGLSAQVSPDGKYLAFVDTTYEYVLKIFNSNGKTISEFPLRFNGRTQSFFNWQNAERLRTIQQNNEWSISVQLLDPITQEHMPLRTDWDEVYTPENPFEDKLVQWKFDQRATELFFVYGANILYDPTLTRVLYPKDDGIVTLVDVETEMELANARFEDWGRLPSWSPNGEYLTILNHEGDVDEFYLISRDGNEFQKITNFSGEFDFIFISEYVWSPDSKQIAFWLDTEPGEEEDGAQSELAVLQIPSKQVTRLCIQGIGNNSYEPWIMNHPEPIWSPDSRYIMITQWDDPASPRNYYVLVIDTVTGAIEKISENTAPIGWMISEP